MSSTSEIAPPPPRPSEPQKASAISAFNFPLSRFSVVLPLCLFSLLWLDLLRQLSYTWSTNEQYAYGYFVPILALGLFLKKWPTRPLTSDPGPQVSGLIPQPSLSSFQLSSLSPRFRFLLSAFCFLLCLLLLPLRVILEINPDWPLITWPYTIIVVALTLYAIHLADPSTAASRHPFNFQLSTFSFHPSTFPLSPWVLHFAFPVAFILISVQWPWHIEYPLTQGLMRVVASLSVEILGLFNIPAMEHGNLIELATGVVGVDEACSGIRSFQSTLMAALFLGELYLFRWLIRVLFVAVGLGLAFALNISRAIFLSWEASSSGPDAIARWHDSAGFTIVIICFVFLWLLALLLKRKWSTQVSSLIPHPSPSTPQLSALTPNRSHSPFSFQLSTFSFLFCVGLWSLFILALTAIWYRPKHDSSFVRWSVELPEAKQSFQQIDIPQRTAELLRYDNARMAKWQEEGCEWRAYFFRWQRGSMQSIMNARYHRPEVCLPSAGFKLVSSPELGYVQVQLLKLPFEQATYSKQNRDLYVFYCVWQDGDEHRKGMRAYGRSDRVVMAIEGKRRFAQQSLEIILDGYPSMAEAARAVREHVPKLIRIEGN